MKTTTKLWIGIGALAVLSPLGIWLPEKFRGGSAWGEWGAGEMNKLVGYIPRGLEKLSSLWSAFLPDYAFKGMENAGTASLSIAYSVSALLGIAACVASGFLIGKVLSRKHMNRNEHRDEEKNQQLS